MDDEAEHGTGPLGPRSLRFDVTGAQINVYHRKKKTVWKRAEQDGDDGGGGAYEGVLRELE